MNKTKKVKLGKRLTKLEKMVSADYDHIWDCCCDHGLLGFQLLESNKVKNLHFVDIVAPLMKEIEDKLQRYYQGEASWFVHCVDVATLPLAEYKSEQGNEKHLIIIAGVGGLLLVELLRSILPFCTTLDIEFILSPVHHNYQLRQFLKEQHCRLIDEVIVEENKRFYELMHIKVGPINNDQRSAISLVGDKMWNFENPEHHVYLQQVINHYQRIAKNPNVDVFEIIKAYQDLTSSV